MIPYFSKRSKRRVRPTHHQSQYVKGAWDAPYDKRSEK